MAKPTNLNKLVRRTVATVDIPTSLRYDNFNWREMTGISTADAEKEVEKLRGKTIRISADAEMFKIQLEAAIEVAKDSDAKHIEVDGDGSWYPSSLKVVGWFEPTQRELNKMLGKAKAHLTRTANGKCKYQINTWAREMEREIEATFKDNDLEMAGLTQLEEYRRMLSLLRDKLNEDIDKLLKPNE